MSKEITKDQYLKAKATVEEYEREEFERNQRQAEWDLEEDDPLMQSCEFCGSSDDHIQGCPNDNTPFALLCREGYD